MRPVCACFVLLALLTTLSLAAPLARGQKEARELWQIRAQNITNDLLKDATDLSSMQRAVLWGKLGQRWWREDPRRARTWITNAIEVVEQVPNKETSEEREERFQTAGVLLAIVTPLDQKLTKRLATLLTGEDKSAANERGGDGDALIWAAVSVVGEDPKRAAELGAMALRTGTVSQIAQLLFPLRELDPKLADSLFVQALVLVKQNPNTMLANSLMHAAFPAQQGHNASLPVPPDPLRVELLQTYLPLLNVNPANGADPNSCGAVHWLAPLYHEFERLLPQQMPILRQAFNRCQSYDPVNQQRINDYTHGQPQNTVESLLKAASDAKDKNVRWDYEYRAANVAQEGKDYELALRILDDMSKEQRGDWWNSARWDWAADGAIEHYQKRRFREMNLMLDAVPSDLQPLAKAAFIDRLPERAVSETAPIIQILNDATRGLRRSSIPAREKWPWNFALLKLTVKYQFADANGVLKDAIAALNQVDYPTPVNLFETFRNVGAPLLEMDEFVVKDALASVTIVPMRAQLRLSLLDATLQRMRNAPQN
ncbi:MAG TPA: hypothetical protein VK274_03310 [Pyrinomonadaceae bacterium]|nr:hypothetical protein [Pyrinomonadaceae bacterium]